VLLFKTQNLHLQLNKLIHWNSFWINLFHVLKLLYIQQVFHSSKHLILLSYMLQYNIHPKLILFQSKNERRNIIRFLTHKYLELYKSLLKKMFHNLFNLFLLFWNLPLSISISLFFNQLISMLLQFMRLRNVILCHLLIQLIQYLCLSN